MTITAMWPYLYLLAAIIGLVVYALSTNPKAA
jgi:hypothetical protein